MTEEAAPLLVQRKTRKGWKDFQKEDQSATLIASRRDMVFTSLHHHSTFSFLDGYGTPEAHVQRAAELGMSKMALTEHGNVSSHVRLEQAADDAGMGAIFGVELYCGKVDEEHKTRRKNHLTVLAETEEGYRNVLRMVSRGYAEGFYFEPTVSGAMLRDHKEGVVVLSGCSGSLLATSLLGGKNIAPEEASYDRAKKQALSMKSLLGDSYYLEVQAFPELETTRNINSAYERMSQETGIPIVATLDAHYTRPEDSEIQQILHNIRPGKKRTMEDQARSWGYDVPLSPLSDKEIYNRLVGTGLSKKAAEQAIRMSAEIGQRCDIRLPKVENLVYPLPDGFADTGALFRKWVNDGWKYRGFDKLRGPERERYVERVKYEMQLIESKGFADYFLMVSDIVQYAKDYRGTLAPAGIPVGPARGSAAASLVCYLMRITEVNPMLFPTLLFERFIDANRHDLPDIDLDFDDELRYMILDYAKVRYGDDRVANLGTFVKFKGKNSLDDVARVYNIPPWEIEGVKKLLITRTLGDLRAGSTIQDSIEMFPKVKEVFDKYPELYKSQKLEGNYKGLSIHAAGLVIANGPLSDFCAIYTRTEDDGSITQVVSLDKYDAEYLNVLKLDALGLNTMALIRIAIENIGMSLQDLYSVPLDEPKALAGFKNNDVVGVFQFDGRAMRSVNQGVSPDNFMEVADVNALSRPGPLHSGATAEYIDVKHGRKPATHYHEIVDEITKHTNFQIVYQEQILQIVRLLGGFSWDDAARIRKIISKKRGEQEFNQQRDKFVDGAAGHGVNGEAANRVFSMLATAGAYAFNAAHCVSYGMLAFWTMWLKVHHPEAFYVGALRKYDQTKMSSLLNDLNKHGRHIKVKPLHPNISDMDWKVYEGDIYPGLVQVPGIGPKMAPRILELREQSGGFKSWDEITELSGIGPAKLEAVEAFSGSSDPFSLAVLGDKIDAMRQELYEGVQAAPNSPFMLPRPTHTAAEVPYEREGQDTRVTWLGVVRERNLKDLFENHHSRTGLHLDPASVKDPNKKASVVMQCEDDTDVITVTVDRWRYPRFKDQVWDIELGKDLVLFKGYKRGNQSRRAIYITDMWIVEPDELEEEEASDNAD